MRHWAVLLLTGLFRLRRALGSPKRLSRLSFIHFARWSFVKQIDEGTGAPQRLAPIYLYFESNFNGTFEQYIDAFSYYLTRNMWMIWGGAYGFPGPKPATRFRAYIRRHDYPAGHYYSAYPEATTTEITAALAVRDALHSLRPLAKTLPSQTFADRWHGFLTGVQRCL
jgi:hypothetical protein